MAPRSIRDARRRRGIGVRQLARLAGVTPGAVSQWEKSEARGTIRTSTIERALRAMGTSLDDECLEPASLTRREDRIALELHRAVARALVDDPDAVLSVVPANLESLRRRVRGDAAMSWLEDWRILASEGSLGRLVDVMLGTDRYSISMRQVSPFAGILSPAERVRAIERAAS